MKVSERSVLQLTLDDEERKMVEEMAAVKGETFEEAFSEAFHDFF